MSIEAVELAHRGDIASFVLVSNDRDFGHAARWLVERGLFVMGVGGDKAPIDWRKSCSRFAEIPPRQRRRPRRTRLSRSRPSTWGSAT